MTRITKQIVQILEVTLINCKYHVSMMHTHQWTRAMWLYTTLLISLLHYCKTFHSVKGQVC